MNKELRAKINKLDSEEKIRKQIRVTHASNHPDKEDMISLLEHQLESLNIDAAMVEETDFSDFGGH